MADIARAHGLMGDAAEMLAHQFTTGFGGKRFDDWIDGLRSAVDDPLLSARVKAAAQQMLDKSVEASDAYAKMKTPGKMYEVNINADPAHFLDWDKPLSAQPASVMDVLKLPSQAQRLNQSLIAKGHPEMTAGSAYTEIRNAGRIGAKRGFRTTFVMPASRHQIPRPRLTQRRGRFTQLRCVQRQANRHHAQVWAGRAASGRSSGRCDARRAGGT